MDSNLTARMASAAMREYKTFMERDDEFTVSANDFAELGGEIDDSLQVLLDPAFPFAGGLPSDMAEAIHDVESCLPGSDDASWLRTIEEKHPGMTSEFAVIGLQLAWAIDDARRKRLQLLVPKVDSQNGLSASGKGSKEFRHKGAFTDSAILKDGGG